MAFVNGLQFLLLSSFLSSLTLLLAAPLEHLVDHLPGQPNVDFKQYAGYINVDETSGTNLFYYFIEAQGNASSLPVALWLNGGPGCSSVGGGAFTELGPFYPNGKGNGLKINTQSWNKVANLLFLESPAGVGWSYTSRIRDGYSYNDWRVANETLVFLLRWFQNFPEYSKSQLFLTGESYAGHYIPQLASLMVNHNRESRGVDGFRFNLRGILIGNPLLNYAVDTSATYSFLWSHGLISDKTFTGVSSSCDFRYGFMGGEAASKEKGKDCPVFLGWAREEIGDFINMYDVTLNVCPPPILHQAFRLHQLMGLSAPNQEIDVCIDQEITRYLNKADVQVALHANLTSLPYSWEACSRIIEYSSVDQLSDIVPLLARLVKQQQQLRIWIFSGDQDSVVPLTGTRLQITKLAKQLRFKTTVPYRAWYAYGQVGGWYEMYGQRLLYATVRGASHMVPYAQPERALVLFSNFLDGRPLLPNP